MNVREWLCDLGYEEAVVFDSPEFDEAIVGVSSDGCVIYDYHKMVDHLVKTDNMSYTDAIEFIDYNTLRACAYVPNAPVVVTDWVRDFDSP